MIIFKEKIVNERKPLSRRDFLKSTLVGTGAAALGIYSLPVAAAASPARAQGGDVTILTTGWPLSPLPTEEEMAGDPGRRGYAEALQLWLDENPGVVFQTVETNIWDQQSIVTAIAGGTAPTYIFPSAVGGFSNAGARAAFAQGLIADTSAAIDAYGLRDKLIPGMAAIWEPITNVNGQYMGYPIDAGADMFYLRRDLIAEAGLEEPPMDWTWDDLFNLARALTSADGSRKGLGASVNMVSNLLNDHGFELLRQVPTPEAGWNWAQDMTSDPMWAALVDEYRKLVFEDGAVYTDISYTNENYFNAFASGATAIYRNNILNAFGSTAQEGSLASLAASLGKTFEEVIMFRPLPRGRNGYRINPTYVGNVGISPDTSADTLMKALGAVDYMFLGAGWDIQKAAQYAASDGDLQVVYNYPLPIDGKYQYEGVPGSFAEAWGQSTLDAVEAAASVPKEPDRALYFPVEQNPGPNLQALNDAWSTVTYVADDTDAAAVLQTAQDTWNSQAAGFSSSVSDEDFVAAARSYYEAVDAFWQEASPEFHESTFRPWYESKVLPVLG